MLILMFGVSLGSPIHLWVVKTGQWDIGEWNLHAQPLLHAHEKWRESTHSDFHFGAKWLLLCVRVLPVISRLSGISSARPVLTDLLLLHGIVCHRALKGDCQAVLWWSDYIIWGSGGGSYVDLRHLRDEAIQRTMTRLSFHLMEGHLWPNLAEMRDTDKASFLDTPISQAGLLSDTVEDFAQQFSVVQKQKEAIEHILPWRNIAATRPPGGWPPVCSSSKASPCSVYICSGAGCYHTSACNVKLPQARALGSH